MRAVKAGGTVEDPGDAPYATRFAHRQALLFLIVAVACAAVTVLAVVDLLVDGLQSPEIYGVAGVVGGATFIFRVRRARRAETLALAFVDRQDDGAGAPT